MGRYSGRSTVTSANSRYTVTWIEWANQSIISVGLGTVDAVAPSEIYRIPSSSVGCTCTVGRRYGSLLIGRKKGYYDESGLEPLMSQASRRERLVQPLRRSRPTSKLPANRYNCCYWYCCCCFQKMSRYQWSCTHVRLWEEIKRYRLWSRATVNISTVTPIVPFRTKKCSCLFWPKWSRVLLLGRVKQHWESFLDYSWNANVWRGKLTSETMTYSFSQDGSTIREAWSMKVTRIENYEILGISNFLLLGFPLFVSVPPTISVQMCSPAEYHEHSRPYLPQVNQSIEVNFHNLLFS